MKKKMKTETQLKNTIMKKRVKRMSILGKLKSPQKKGIAIKVRTVKPKKPNSAQRKIVKIKIQIKNEIKKYNVYIPGENQSIQEHNIVMIRGGKTQDLPGMKYKIIRGKYEVSAVEGRKKGRSKYGVKKTVIKEEKN